MLHFNKKDINEIVSVLNHDGIIAFPTETVYGLGVKADKEENFKRLVEVKKRPADKPFTLMCANKEIIHKYAIIDGSAKKIIDRFMPGKITLILKAKKGIKHYLDLGSGYIGFRIPDDEFVLSILKKLDSPLLVPSANISSYPPAMNDKEVEDYFGDNIDGVVNGSINLDSIPSTVIKLDGSTYKILRAGPIKESDIKECLKW